MPATMPAKNLETLAEERREHALTIEMGNLCGQPVNTPGGSRASSVAGHVTCPACRELLAAREPRDSI